MLHLDVESCVEYLHGFLVFFPADRALPLVEVLHVVGELTTLAEHQMLARDDQDLLLLVHA